MQIQLFLSIKLLNYLWTENGEIINLDLNIICDYPKINPIRNKIKKNLSKILKINEDIINIKATSTEDEGFINTKRYNLPNRDFS